MMDKETAKLWVDALRSGEYKQGQGSLCQNDRFCCLGVLYDVAVDGYWTEDPENPGTWGIDVSGTLICAVIPPLVLKEVGLPPNGQSDFIVYNDNKQLSFKEIAAIIEDRYITNK